MLSLLTLIHTDTHVSFNFYLSILIGLLFWFLLSSSHAVFMAYTSTEHRHFNSIECPLHKNNPVKHHNKYAIKGNLSPKRERIYFVFVFFLNTRTETRRKNPTARYTHKSTHIRVRTYKLVW